MTFPPGPHGYAYAPPPPPPKPGVIPLAPLGLGQILGGAFTTIGRYWKPLLGVAAVAFGAALLALAAAVGVAYALVADQVSAVFDPTDGRAPGWEESRALLIAFAGVWLIATVGMVAASALVYAACPAVLQDAVVGRRTTFGVVWRRALSRTPAVFATVFLTLLLTVPLPLLVFTGTFVGLLVALSGSGPVALVVLSFGGAVLATLLTAPFSAWLWVKFSLAPSAAVMEGQGPLAAMRRSSRLVSGSWWRIFGCTLVAGLIAAVANWVLQQVLNMVVSTPLSVADGPSADSPGDVLLLLAPVLVIATVGSLVGQFVTSVLPPLVTGLLYVDQRIRKENLAPELARAAGLG
ncbi:oxidoreductase [Streptomyces sp. NPDC003327]